MVRSEGREEGPREKAELDRTVHTVTLSASSDTHKDGAAGNCIGIIQFPNRSWQR